MRHSETLKRKLAQDRFHLDHNSYNVDVVARLLSGKECTFNFDNAATISDLAEIINCSLHIPMQVQQIVYKGSSLDRQSRGLLSDILGATCDGEVLQVDVLRKDIDPGYYEVENSAIGSSELPPATGDRQLGASSGYPAA